MKSPFATIVFSLSAALVALVAMPASAQQMASCSFHDYSIPNAGFTNLNGINNKGHFVGTYSYKDQYRSFLFNGSRHDVVVANALQVEARGINNNDTIAGDYYDPKLQRQRGFLLNGRYLTTFDFPGAQATIASATNDSSVTVGEYYNGSGGHGFVRYSGKIVSLDRPGASSTWATGINNKNQISGVYQDGNGINHGFLYANGKFTNLNFPGADNTSALGISPNGTVIGNYFKNGRGHGFVYVNGQYKDATYPNGSQSTIPVGINSNSVMTGGYIDASGREHGFTANSCH